MPDVAPTENESVLLAIADAARVNNWCLQFPCTTCATQDLRGEITRWVLSDPSGVASELSNLGVRADEADLVRGACVRIALGQLETIEQPKHDRFTVAFVEHAPAGGSVVNRIIGAPVTAHNIRSKLRSHRARWGSHLRSSILEAWIDSVTRGDIRRIDRIIFYQIRSLGDARVRDLWLAKGAALAVDTGDISLHETLVWSLGPTITAFPALVESLRQHRLDPLISRALRESGAEAVFNG